MNGKNISIVVPTHNRADSLVRLLNSFKKLKDFPTEIILINDGSEDQTEVILNLSLIHI